MKYIYIRVSYVYIRIYFICFSPLLDFVLKAFSLDRYSFCFIRICCCFTVRNHDVLLDYMGTPQYGPHGYSIT